MEKNNSQQPENTQTFVDTRKVLRIIIDKPGAKILINPNPLVKDINTTCVYRDKDGNLYEAFGTTVDPSIKKLNEALQVTTPASVTEITFTTSS